MNNLSCHIPYNLLPNRGAGFPLQLYSRIINGAANELAAKMGVGKDMAAMAIVTTGAVVGHALYDLQLPDGGMVPSTTNFLGIGHVGTGKTKTAEHAMRLLREFQKEQVADGKKRSTESKVKEAIWNKQRNAILEQVPLNLDNSSNEDIPDCFVEQLTIQLEERLIEHEEKKPKKAQTLKLTTENATMEAIHLLLSDYPAVTIYSTEFSTIMKSRAINHEDQWSSLWSGSPLIIDRKSGESFELHNVRLGFVAWGQHSNMATYIAGKGNLARDNGFMSRILIFIAQAQGYFPISSYGSLDQEQIYFDMFESRISELLLLVKEKFDNQDRKREVIGFTPEAAERYKQLKWEIDQQKAPGMRFARAHDHASRLPEQIARLALHIQMLEEPNSAITIDILQDAINICAYCSDCFLTIFDPPPQEYQDAQLLNEWMNYNLRSNPNVRLVYKNHVRQFGPNSLREKNRLNHALMLLQQQGIIGLFMWGRHHVINLYPHVPIDNGTISYFLGNPKK